jgi:ubiquinone/menaquinone biosynthesis C-methylase UbiE
METTFIPVAYSDSIPDRYDKHLGQLLLEPFAENLARHALDTKPNFVLALACGTGRLTKYLIDILAGAAKIIATDINADMQAFAKANLLNAASVMWQLVDAQALPFADNSFDLVISQFGAMFFDDRIRAYKEAQAKVVTGVKPAARY